ncbi:MAG TPA: GTP 3',8-cyclase MoaA [Acidimicrobiales bacterium]|nr:GTP 3',8-cyclase MoaA [Acidimicrobiales bacterium]
MTEVLADGFGRVVRDLRVSITDRCNFRCTYCMPAEGMVWQERSELLSFEEIERVVGIFVRRFGVTGVRLTGGEPTVRAHLPLLVAKLAKLDPRPELALTTNGATLGLVAADLRQAGLDRLNISCDSLRADRFAEITKRDALDRVLDGIAAAKEAGFPVKLNCVLMRGVNEDEIVDFATFGRTAGVSVRFIEFMPLDAQGAWTADRVVPSSEVLERIAAAYPIEAVAHGPEPAARFRYVDGGAAPGGEEVGVIASVTQPFCGDCDRVRMTADGQFFTCLFALDGHDVRAVLRRGGSDDEVAEILRSAVGAKWAGHQIGRVTFVRPPRSMSQIGG